MADWIVVYLVVFMFVFIFQFMVNFFDPKEKKKEDAPTKEKQNSLK